MPFSNGTRVSDDGRVRTNAVANTYVPIATDVFIGGCLHDSVGNMYHTVNANAGASDVFINGIRHTANGVRYTDNAASDIPWPEGFTIDIDGRQKTVNAAQTLFIRGIGRNISGRMAIQAA